MSLWYNLNMKKTQSESLNVMHTNIHLVPRYQRDEFNIKWVNQYGQNSPAKMNELQQALKL